MKKSPYILAIFILISVAFTYAQEKKSESTTDNFTFKVGYAKLNKSQWAIPYRFVDKKLKSVSVKLTITSNTHQTLNTNLLSLINTNNKTRIRASGVYYERANSDKRKYFKVKATNKNYTPFEDNSLKGYTNFQAKTFKPNFFGKRKKDELPSVKSLKKIKIKSEVTYFIDFPVKKDFKKGNIYYKTTKIGEVSL